MPAITSNHVNYLVWRYLQEEGLALSGYTLDKETHASQWAAEFKDQTGDGELVKLVLKGLQMLEIEKVRLPPEVRESSRSRLVNLEPVADARLQGAYAAAFAGAAPGAIVVGGADGVAAYALPGLAPFASDAFAAAESATCIEASAPDTVFIGYDNGTVRHWVLQGSATELQGVFMLPDADHAPVTGLKRAPAGPLLASIDVRNVVALWDTSARTLVARIDLGGVEAGVLTDAVWVADAMLATLRRDSIAVYAVGEAAPRKVFPAPRASQLAFDGVSRLLASGSDDGVVRLWSSHSDEPYGVMREHAAPITHVAWVAATPLSQPQLLTASLDGWLKLWTLGTPGPAAAVDARDAVYAVQASDAYIVAVTKGGVKVYTRTLDKCIAQYARDGVQSIALHDRTLAVAAKDETTVYRIAFEPAESIEPVRGEP